MFLMPPVVIQRVVDNAVVLLDTGADVPEQADVVSVVFKGSADYDPCVRIVAGCDAMSITKVVLTTLDLCTKTEFPPDLIGIGCLGDSRLRGACQHSSEVVASVLWNITQYQQQIGADVVHLDACQHAVAGDSYTIVVHSLFDKAGYSPQVSITNEGALIYMGDPGCAILFNQ